MGTHKVLLAALQTWQENGIRSGAKGLESLNPVADSPIDEGLRRSIRIQLMSCWAYHDLMCSERRHVIEKHMERNYVHIRYENI